MNHLTRTSGTDRRAPSWLRWRALAVLVLAAGLVPLWSVAASARPDTNEAAATPNPLAGTRWVLDPASLGVPVPAGRSITAYFETTTVGGSAACNLYSGDYQVGRGRRLTIGRIITTKMACTPEPAAAESAYLRKLAAVTAFRLSRNRLVLTGSAGSLRYRPAPPAASALIGSWKVTGVSGGFTGGLVPLVPNTSISLNIKADGTLGGEACNLYSAPWKSDASSLSIGDVTSTLRLCIDPPGASDQETRYFNALRAVTAWRVDGSTLFLNDASGKAIVSAAPAKA